MRIDWWTLALQAINVLVLVWLLGYFLYKPVVKAIVARQAAADKLLQDAEGARVEAERNSTALQAQMAGLAEEAGQRRAEALAAVEVERQGLLDKAAQEAAAKQAQLEAALARQRQLAAQALQAQAVELAAAMAGKLLAGLPPAVATQALFQTLLDRIQALPDDERQRIAQGADAARIVTATPLDAADQARCLAALEKTLQRKLAAQFAVDPALIAGFEFSANGVAISNSWRADLAALSRSVTESSDVR
jgi:F-type H+-transporting ATPase subunit b